jgi:hypothetical protein
MTTVAAPTAAPAEARVLTRASGVSLLGAYDGSGYESGR